MDRALIQKQASPIDLGEEARLRLQRAYLLIISLAEEKTADAEDPAANQASESAVTDVALQGRDG